MTETAVEKFIARWNFAAFKARCFIQGTVTHPVTRAVEPRSGYWSDDFLGHETVQLAEAEGWSRDLRGAVFPPIRHRIMEGRPHAILNDFMPSEKWIAETRNRVAIENRSQAWQGEMMEKFGSMQAWTSAVARGLQDAPPQMANKRVTFKPIGFGMVDFNKMQRSSPNKYLHRAPLSERSRSMMGENT